MDINKFKHIVGEARENEVATIKFFDTVTKNMVDTFNYEFEYLEKCVRPSLIRVLINCEGGSVLYGMSAYAVIQNSSVPTECINEGLAASMGSVIWTAGNKSLMRDYAILMIHNPFVRDQEAGQTNDDTPDIVAAFTKQLEIIYQKRFGLSQDRVKQIMAGEADKDGTFFDADAAVQAGIIPRANILCTSKQVCAQVKSELEGVDTASKIKDVFANLTQAAEVENKQSENTDTNLSQTGETTPTDEQIKKPKQEKRMDGLEVSAIAATLGVNGQEPKDVMARISKLMTVEAALVTKEKELTDAHTVIAGKETAITNLTSELTSVQAQLSTYKEKEAAEKKAKIEATVQAAVDAGKIQAEAKAQWVAMAESNLELATSTLASIPAREKISEQISQNADNIDAAANAVPETEKVLAEKVVAVVGKDFAFKTLS